MAVEPTLTDLQRFLDEDDGGPVVMLNLLRFAGEAGRASFAEYGARVQPLLEEAGAALLYAGECSTALVAAEEQEWDLMLMVRYPSRQAFLKMVNDPAYLEISGLRAAALDATLLQATIPWGQ